MMLHRSVRMVQGHRIRRDIRRLLFFELTHVLQHDFLWEWVRVGGSETLCFELTCDYRVHVTGVCVDAEACPAAGRPAPGPGCAAARLPDGAVSKRGLGPFSPCETVSGSWTVAA